MKVALQIKELVDERGWDVAELARVADIDERLAQDLYNGRPTDIDLASESRISQALGVRPDEILADVVEPQPSASEAPMPRSLHDTEGPRDPALEKEHSL